MPEYRTTLKWKIAISITFYHPWKYQTATRKYPLRNLRGESLEQKVAHADEILTGIAEELRYITGGHGISEGAIHVDGKLRAKRSFVERFPAPEGWPFLDYVLRMKFWTVVVGLRDGEVISESRRDKTINVPALPASPLNQPGTRRAKRDDPIFQRFCSRFGKESNLGLHQYYECWGELMDASFKMMGTVKKTNKRPATKKVPEKRKASKTHFIYLIHFHDDIYKIGQSKDPQRRLRALQTSNPYTLTLVHSFPADKPDQAERALHQCLDSSRREGEWFSLSSGQLQTISSIVEYGKRLFLIDGTEVDAHELASRLKS
jgi:hypothetical protein